MGRKGRGMIGFFGGKFLPLHKGHLYCIDVASRECDQVLVIMFIGGTDELDYFKEQGYVAEELLVESRIRQLEKICALYPNVSFRVIDTTELKKPDGSEDWEAETPLVRQFLPHMDYVYSSEPSYDAYFRNAYPEAIHHIVDAERVNYPISGTMIRCMELLEEKKKWMV